MAICAIVRNFWPRVWAAIRNKPTTERRRMLASVRVVIANHSGKELDLDALKESIDHARPAGVLVVVEDAKNFATYCGHCP